MTSARGYDGGQRHAAGEGLRDGDEVGAHARVLHREHLAGAAETALHLIDDEQDAVLVAQAAQRRQQLVRRDVETTSPCTGSMMIAATLVGATSALNSVSSAFRLSFTVTP
ncbi:MAG: hypothetical protein U1F35_17650 [Steroidobacteraceae bacterium]